MYSLTVIVPFYNEEKFLEKSIIRLQNSEVADYIFLVDDSSIDNSKNIAKTFVDKSEKIKYFQTDSNQGKGAALIYIKDFLKTSHVAIHDADLEYNPVDLLKMKQLSSLNRNSLILGSRFIGNIERSNLYKSTFYANKILSKLFSIINLYKVTDIATCYKMFPVSFFKNTNITQKGFSIEVELLSKFLKYNKSVYEIPIKYEGRSFSEGKKISLLDGCAYIYNIFRYRLFN